ncbi:hypothetical protein MFFC18_26600 [Mariniblastus fucicola]|uniref:Uncharacterized protein n=1 Tax=Mariniblastus fucicola TaxID=980251 RepID=A0A5B9P7Y0_9BACT|nr:hypothetical protein MFFC18_26600 [Mariniblastus fucicola]
MAERIKLKSVDETKVKEGLGKLQREYNEKVKKLQEKLQEDVVDALPKEIQLDFTELVGDIYKVR